MQDSNLVSQLLLTSYLLYSESPLDCKEMKPVNPKGNQLWIFIGRTDAEAPILWPPDVKSWLIGKDPDAGRDWGQEEKGMTEDEMAGWHHRLDGRESEWTPGDGEGQGSLMWGSPWGHKSQTWLSNWTTTTLHWLSLEFLIISSLVSSSQRCIKKMSRKMKDILGLPTFPGPSVKVAYLNPASLALSCYPPCSEHRFPKDLCLSTGCIEPGGNLAFVFRWVCSSLHLLFRACILCTFSKEATLASAFHKILVKYFRHVKQWQTALS